MPGSPGTSQPFGAVGNCVDCTPGTRVSILSSVSYHGMLASHRSPRFKVRFGLTRKESCTYAAPYLVRESRNWMLLCTYELGAPSRKSAKSLPVSEPLKPNTPLTALERLRSF